MKQLTLYISDSKFNTFLVNEPQNSLSQVKMMKEGKVEKQSFFADISIYKSLIFCVHFTAVNA